MAHRTILRFSMFAVLLSLSAGLVRAELSSGELRTKFESALEQEQLAYGAKKIKLEEGYVGALERLKTTLGREEKLEQATQVLAEIEAITSGGELGELSDKVDYRLRSLRTKLDVERKKQAKEHARAIVKMAETYLRVLDDRKRSLTRRGEIRAAVVVDEEMNRVRESPVIVEANLRVSAGKLTGKRGAGDLALATKGAKAQAQHGPDKLIDGIVENHRMINGYAFGVAPCQFLVELNTLYVIDRIRIMFWDFDDRRHKYTIEVSPDNKEWKMVADHRTDSVGKGWQETKFAPSDVRYIRVSGVELLNGTLSKRFIVVEVEAYSPK